MTTPTTERNVQHQQPTTTETPAMTRKDYQIIALALNTAWHAADTDPLITHHADARRAIEHAMEAIANGLADDNPRFDRHRFMAAAHPDVSL